MSLHNCLYSSLLFSSFSFLLSFILSMMLIVIHGCFFSCLPVSTDLFCNYCNTFFQLLPNSTVSISSSNSSFSSIPFVKFIFYLFILQCFLVPFLGRFLSPELFKSCFVSHDNWFMVGSTIHVSSCFGVLDAVFCIFGTPG